jgi:ribosome-binding protein aMBF1 (putative translation factor)
MENLGDIIKFHREKSGLSRMALAQLADVGKTVIFDIEHAKKTVRINTLLKILQVLNIQIEFKSALIR